MRTVGRIRMPKFITAAALAVLIIGLFATGPAAAEGDAAIPETAATAPKSGQESTFKVNLSTLVNEVQKSSQESKNITLVMWFPDEYWETAIAENGRMTDEQVQEFIKVTRPYSILGVASGDYGIMGGLTYASEDEIRSNIKLLDDKAASLAPLDAESLDPDFANVLIILKPVIANMLGQFGENLHFIVFNNLGPDGNRIIDPTKPGAMSVMVKDRVFRWKLPLNALMAPKTCPNCKEECSGAWGYCPWDGAKLQDASM